MTILRSIGKIFNANITWRPADHAAELEELGVKDAVIDILERRHEEEGLLTQKLVVRVEGEVSKVLQNAMMANGVSDETDYFREIYPTYVESYAKKGVTLTPSDKLKG